MKKTVILICSILWICSIIAFDQSGIRGGLNISSISGEKEYNNSRKRNGFSVGLWGRNEVKKEVFFQTEINYSQKGFTQSKNIEETQLQIEDTFNYLEFNAFYIFKLNRSKPLGVFAGSSVSYLYSATEKVTIETENSQTSITQDMSSVDLGIICGLNINLSSNLFIEGRYNYGLSNIITHQQAKNRVLGISLGYSF